MNGDYKERFTRINQLITGEGINEYARKTGSRTFGRKCKMPLSDLLAYTLSKQGLTTELKLQKYYQSRRRTEKRVSKQGYLQLRKRLNPEVFRYMNQECLCGFYGGAAPKTWEGQLILAIDWSKAEASNSEENRNVFGQSNHQPKVLVYNMIRDIRNSASAKVCKRASGARNKCCVNQ